MKALSVLTLIALLSMSASSPAQDPKSPPPPDANKKKAFKNLSVDEFDKMRADKNALVLDVRTPAEFAAGHIPGAKNIDWNAPDFAQKISALDKDKVYLVHCAAGRRSARASEKLATLDFRKVYNLEAGFNAWQKAGKPVEK